MPEFSLFTIYDIIIMSTYMIKEKDQLVYPPVISSTLGLHDTTWNLTTLSSCSAVGETVQVL